MGSGDDELFSRPSSSSWPLSRGAARSIFNTSPGSGAVRVVRAAQRGRRVREQHGNHLVDLRVTFDVTFPDGAAPPVVRPVESGNLKRPRHELGDVGDDHVRWCLVRVRCMVTAPRRVLMVRLTSMSLRTSPRSIPASTSAVKDVRRGTIRPSTSPGRGVASSASAMRPAIPARRSKPEVAGSNPAPATHSQLFAVWGHFGARLSENQ
jgi:hypothetical protein